MDLSHSPRPKFSIATSVGKHCQHAAIRRPPAPLTSDYYFNIR
jgi:hypothetical protein